MFVGVRFYSGGHTFWRARKRLGRGRDLLRNNSMKYVLPSMDFHSFDTQRNLATDLAGNLESISIIIFIRLSVSIDVESGSSPPLIILRWNFEDGVFVGGSNFQAWMNTRVAEARGFIGNLSRVSILFENMENDVN